MLTRLSIGTKRRAARAMSKLAYGFYLKVHELEIRNSHLYLPCRYFETAGTLRSVSTIKRYEQVRGCISETLGEKPESSILDLGCNEGYFTLRLASEGFWVCGIDADPGYLRVARFLQQKYSVHGASFYQLTANKDTILRLPTFDVVIFMSVFQKWCSQFGFSEAFSMLSTLWQRTKRIMFFEMPDSLESADSFKTVLPHMGETKEECRDYIKNTLGGLGSCSVTWIADNDMDYRPERRSLFAITRVPMAPESEGAS